MKHGVVHILLPVIDDRGIHPREEVEVSPIDGGRYRVLCPPRFVYGLAAGDEIELDDSTAGYRTVRRSGNLTIWIYVADDHHRSAVEQACRGRVSSLVGWVVEGTPPKMVIITAPRSAGWTNVQAAMNEICSTAPDTSWEYANVYDAVTQAPLDWWK